MSTSADIPASTAPPADPTGKRRIAFASYVDVDRLPGFLRLLRSLALTNPGVCEDYVVLHDGLSDAAADRIRALHPRAELRRIDADRCAAHAKRGPHEEPAGPADYAVLEAFRLRGHGTVVVLDTAVVARGRLDGLLRLRDGLAAAPRADGQPGLDGGVLVVQRAYLTDDFCARLDAVADGGDYVLERHGLGVLEAVLDGEFVALDNALGTEVPFAARPLADDPAAETDGPQLDRLDQDDADFHAAFMALPATAHHDLLVSYGTAYVARTGDLQAARRVATARIAAGEYQEAVDLLASVRIPLDEAWPHEVFGHALMSVSRYDEARAHLLLSTAVPGRAATAFARLAQIAWVRGDDEQAERYALAGLSADPTHGPSRQMLQRRTLDLPGTGGPKPVKEGSPRRQLAHVAFYMPHRGNAGDKLLPEAVRLTFGKDAGPRRWHSIHAHRLFDEAALERVNARRALVIGGGGLFIPDTAPNGNSAWQWNVPDELLARIEVPVVVYAVGFNAFDGQSYRQERFATALRRLVEKASFFGLRNHGSIEKVRRLLPAELHGKVRFQPCPTTVTRQLVDGWTDPASREDTVLVNAAYDRAGLRFGHDYGHFLAHMASAIRRLGARAEVRCVAHAPDDERFAFDLRREHGVSLPVIPMYDYTNDEIRDVYARTRLVIGMRGHAGMIPFGCGTPIISLVSHPKMAYFLADVGRPEWGVSVHDRDLAAVLTERAAGMLDAHDAAVADVHGRQAELWGVTQANAVALRELL